MQPQIIFLLSKRHASTPRQKATIATVERSPFRPMPKHSPTARDDS